MARIIESTEWCKSDRMGGSGYTWSQSASASAGWVRDALLSSHCQACNHPGVMVGFISTEIGGANVEKSPRKSAI